MFFFAICQSSNNENKICQDTVQAFTKITAPKNTPEKLWVDKRADYGGSFKKFCEFCMLKYEKFDNDGFSVLNG